MKLAAVFVAFLLLWLGFQIAVVLVTCILFCVFPNLRRWAFGAFSNEQRRRDAAEETLRGRLARGEIDAEEYESALEVLRREKPLTVGEA